MTAPSVREAWRNLERKLRPFVVRRVRAHADVDDIVQNVFLRMHRGLVGVRDQGSLDAWVYQVARNTIADDKRRAARHPAADRAGGEVAAEQDLDDRAVERDLANHVGAFVAALSSPYREALRLTELEGLPQREAANVLGVSLSAMKSRVQRARRQLRKALEDCCHIELDARGRALSCEPRTAGQSPVGCCR